MTAHFKRALPVLLYWLALSHPLSAVAAPADCPTAATAHDGFIVERSHQTTEVVPAGDRLVRTIYRTSTGETVLETTAFEGLFEVERIDRGRRTVFHSTTNFAAFFPPKVGRDMAASFESGDAPQVTKTKVFLRVVRTDNLFIESCKYGVFAIDRRIGQGGVAPVLVETDYYAPDLKLIIAKESKNPDGTTFLAKFDKIYAEKH